ncbi:MAG: ABC transporter substrate-binding protein [Rhodospirillum sp.]|nr:ABC transporter substrate-binding protein [Rhodospirillum sp.]MCF8490110.1 ABC transporter substrate-binding protein [Rhodospirillum sp.]MCF8501128.1 ABC transporter substrate-binding protein [Rhodospirillum sp.]
MPSPRHLSAAVFCLALSSAPALANPISITDQAGLDVTLDGPANRIVTIPIPAASMITAIDGGPDRLSGMHPLSKSALMDGILGAFFPDMASIPSDVVGNGFMPNVEAVLALNPDLVFQWGHLGGDVINPLRNAGLTVATVTYGTEDLARGWIEMMGKATGETQKAQRMLDWRDSTLADIRATMGDLPQGARPRVLYFNRFLSEMKVSGPGTYNDFYIGLAGGRNPAAVEGAPAWQVVNAEQLMAWDPEVILLNGFEPDLSPADVYGNPLLAGLSAVKSKRVYQIPLGGYRWDPPNQESPLMWTWLSMVLHPEKGAWPLRKNIVEAYAWLYGQTPTEDQIDGILRLAANSGASGYDTFARTAKP